MFFSSRKKAIFAGRARRSLIFLVATIVLAACSPESLTVELESSSSLSGKVTPFSQVSSEADGSASTTCADVTIKLYRINDDGGLAQPELSSTSLKQDGTFDFSGLAAQNLGITANAVTASYVIVASGCDKVYSRLVTKGTDQDISFGSSMISYALTSSKRDKVKAALLQSKGEKIETLISQLDAKGDFENIYNSLKTETTLQSSFQELFGGSPEILANSSPIPAPRMKLSAEWEEKKSYTLSANAYHWNSSYNAAYEWKKGNKIISTSATVNYTPGANDQEESAVIALKVGHNDGTGKIDPAKPSYTRLYYRKILNTVPAQVPQALLASSSNTANPQVFLQLSTGASLINCESFSRLAITENTPNQPPTALFDAQNLQCTDDLTQNISYILNDTSDGQKILRIWAKDAQGNISQLAQTVTLTLNMGAVTIAYTSPADGTVANSTLTVTGTCDNSFPVEIQGDISPTLSIACSSGAFSQAITFSSGEGNKTVTISQTDLAANTVSDTRTFVNDTIAPALAFTSPAANTEAQTGVTITGTCEGNLPINLSGGGLASPSSTACSGGTFSQAVNFTPGDGSKTITVAQTDAAGNTGSASRTFVRDNTAPVLAFTSPAANTEAQTGVTITGTCEGSLTVDLSGTGLTSPSSTTCSSGAFSQAVTFTAGEGNKIITVSQTDPAGNTGSASRTFVRDNTAPVLAFTSPAANTEAQTGVTITGTCEGSLTVDLSGTGLASPSSTTCSAGAFSQAITFTAGEGNKVITVSQTDPAGNTGSASRTFIRDNTAPVLAFISPAANTEAQTGVTITGTCEGSLTVDLSGTGLASPASTTCSAGAFSQAITFTAGEGNKVITVSQTDPAGNTGSASRTFIRDNTAPVLAFTSPAANTEAQTGVTITGTCEGSLTVDLSGTGLASPSSTTCSAGAFSQAITFTAGEGNKVITVSQTDPAGNTGSASRTFIRDNTAPVLAFTSPAANTEAQTGVTITGTCEGSLTVNLSGAGLASPASTTCSAGAFSQAITFTAGEGNKVITVSQTDPAGNTGNASRTFVRDNTAPVLAFTSPAANTEAQTGVTITGTCEGSLTVDLSGTGLASPASTTCSAGAFSQAITFTAGEGNKIITVSQTDPAGNTGSASRTFVRDNTAPILTIASPAANTPAQASVTLSGVCEANLTINYSGSGILSDFSGTCSAGATYSQQVFFSAGDGTKTLSVSQTDAAGNNTTVSRDFIRDNVAPAISQTTLAFPTYSKNDSVTFGGPCETGLTVTIKLSGITESTTGCAAGSWSYTTVAQTVDATYDYTFTQTDTAGNSQAVNGRWIRDTVTPTLTMTSSNNQLTASDSVIFSGNCESGLPSPIAVSDTDSSTATCSAGSWSYTTATQTTDSTRGYTFTLTDQAGNSTNVSGQWERNTQVPNLVVTTTDPIINTDDSAIINGNCETGLNIEIRLNSILENTISCPAGTFSYTVVSQTSDASRAYEFKQTNALSLSTTAIINWIRDTAPPVFSASFMKINSDAAQSSKARVSLALKAVDALTKVSRFCFKTDDTTQALASDSCWVDVDSAAMGLTPALTVTVSSYGYNLPITPGSYTVYAWAQDEAGNISALSNAGAGTANQDFDAITYVQPSPPVVTQVLIGSTDFPANPPSQSDLTVGIGQPVYIKWQATDDDTLPAGAVSIYFSTDDVNWTLVQNGLQNGQNGGACSVDNASTPADDSMTGCYQMSAAPTSGYIKFRVIVKDATDLEAGASSVGLNVASTLRFLAGNTDPGLNLSAQAAMFFSQGSENSFNIDKTSLVVSRDGVIYFKDRYRGIVSVDPADGIQRVYLNQTGTTSGDGGPVSAATAKVVLKITLDYQQPQQRMWIVDGDLIRRIDLATGIITTVAGGGSDTADTVADPLTAKLKWYGITSWNYWAPAASFFALPNGDFYFKDGADLNTTYGQKDSYRIRYIEASSGQLKTWKAADIQESTNHSATDMNDCEFRDFALLFDSSSNISERFTIIRTHPYWTYCNTLGDNAGFVRLDAAGNSMTSPPPKMGGDYWSVERGKFIQGLDRNLYFVIKGGGSAGLWKFDQLSNTWNLVVGTGAPGHCADGTLATSCPIVASDAFISEDGTVYFADAGQIRTVKPDGTVLTLAGQSYLSGVGSSALAARLGSDVRYFGVRNDGGVAFSSLAYNTVFEFEPSGNLYHIAGNGVIGAANTTGTVDATQTPLNLEHPNSTGDDFALDPSTGEIYHHAGQWYLSKLTRDSGSIGAIGRWLQWQTYTGSAKNYADPAADGTSDIRFDIGCTQGFDAGTMSSQSCWIFPQAEAIGGGQLLIHKNEMAILLAGGFSATNSMFKLWDLSTQVQTHLAGKLGSTGFNNMCADSTSVDNCEVPSIYVNYTLPPAYDATNDRWLLAKNGGTEIYSLQTGGTKETLATLPRTIKAMTYAERGGDEYIYYCGNADSKLYKYNVTTSTETALAWPIANMACNNFQLHWNSTTNRLTFVYKLNNMVGFAEYLD